MDAGEIQVTCGIDRTVMPDSVPVMLEVAVSVAVIDCVPAVSSVTEKVWVPASAAMKEKPDGRRACASLLLKETVPVYPVATLPYASLAVTVTLSVVPAISMVGKPVTFRVVAVAGLTAMFDSAPVRLDGTRSGEH